MLAQGRRDAARKHGYAILTALAVADEDFFTGEVDVFDAKPQTLHDAQPGSIKQPAD